MLKLGVMGTAWITKDFIDGAVGTDKYTLNAIYSHRMNKIKDTSYPQNMYFDDIDIFLKQDIDVVYIATPNNVHYEHCKTALLAKKHVICEKPIVSSSDEFKGLVKIANENDVYIFEAIRNTNIPEIIELTTKLEGLGIIRNFNFNFNQYSSRYDDYKDGKITRIFSPTYNGGSLYDLAVYPLHMAYFLFGKPLNISHFSKKLDNNVEVVTVFVLEYDSFIGTISASKICNGSNVNEILTEDNLIVFDHITFMENISITNRKTKEEETISSSGFYNMQYEAMSFYDIIKNKNEEEYNNKIKQSLFVLETIENL